MGIKTTISYKGVVSERIEGSDALHIDIPRHDGYQYFTAGTGGSISGSLAVFEGSAAGVTASLPAISPQLVGRTVTVVNANLTADIQVSASNPIDLGTYVYTMPEESAAFVAISSSTGYGWIMLSAHV